MTLSLSAGEGTEADADFVYSAACSLSSREFPGRQLAEEEVLHCSNH